MQTTSSHGEWYRPVAATYAAHPALTAATLVLPDQAGPTPALAFPTKAGDP